MKILVLVLVLVLVMVTTLIPIQSAKAELTANDVDVGLQINGVSYHRDQCGGVPQCNEKNDGFGLEIALAYDWPVHIATGRFDNSLNLETWYFGAAKTYRMGDKGDFGLELGAFAGAIYFVRSVQGRGDWYPVLMPTAIVDFKYLRMNISYLPKVTEDISAAIFVQAVVPILRHEWFQK